MKNKPLVGIVQGAGKNLTWSLHAYKHEIFSYNQSIIFLNTQYLHTKAPMSKADISWAKCKSITTLMFTESEYVK